MSKTKIDFLQVLAQKRELVWQEIKTCLDSFTKYPVYCRPSQSYASLINFHKKIVSDYPNRKGKYFRPTLTLLTARAMGYPEKKAIKTAAAMQVSEDWILGHDDIEDNSLERRGKPALHRLYGKELAINAGDALQVIMWKILRDNFKVVGSKRALAIIDEFYWMLNRTTLGQTIEIKWTQENKVGLADRDVLLIMESKTAYYSVAGPMRLGAILAGATEKQLKALYQFGKYLGNCFQIRDDLLDLTSDFEGLKKQTGNDIYEGKRTIMLMHLFRTIKGQEKQRLMKIMKKSREGKTISEVKWVIRMMKKYNSLEYGEKLAEKFAAKARDFFDKELGFLAQQPARDQLKAGVDFVLKRKF